MGLWLLLGGLGILLIGGIAAAAVYFFVFSKPAPHFARYSPKTTTVYIEMPSLKKSMISARTSFVTKPGPDEMWRGP